MCPEQPFQENGEKNSLGGALGLMPLSYEHTQGFSSCTQGGWDQKTEVLVEPWLSFSSHHQLDTQAQAKVSAVLRTCKKKKALARDALRNLQGTMPVGNTVQV